MTFYYTFDDCDYKFEADFDRVNALIAKWVSETVKIPVENAEKLVKWYSEIFWDYYEEDLQEYFKQEAEEEFKSLGPSIGEIEDYEYRRNTR